MRRAREKEEEKKGKKGIQPFAGENGIHFHVFIFCHGYALFFLFFLSPLESCSRQGWSAAERRRISVLASPQSTHTDTARDRVKCGYCTTQAADLNKRWELKWAETQKKVIQFSSSDKNKSGLSVLVGELKQVWSCTAECVWPDHGSSREAAAAIQLN